MLWVGVVALVVALLISVVTCVVAWLKSRGR